MTAVIRTDALTKKYRRVAALDHVNLEVQEGAVYALVGQNGAGKTTAIKILMNLIPASQGTAKVLGTDSRTIRGKFYAQIGYVSENQEIPEWMKVGALLDYLRDFYPTWDLALEQSLVKQFDLPLDRKIKALSRGMKMKLALAGALAFHPRLIVLDEPFGGLDPLVRDQLIEGLLERAAESTVFLSSHDLAEIESFASHVGYLESGKLLFSEDMTSLSTRFREVELTRDSNGPLPSPLPDNWLQPKTSGAIVRFVDSRFDEQTTPAEIQRLFGTVRDVQYRALSLRAIFLAMARKSEEV
jgi:ABC-2 type transport system ATP-binding protein